MEISTRIPAKSMPEPPCAGRNATVPAKFGAGTVPESTFAPAPWIVLGSGDFARQSRLAVHTKSFPGLNFLIDLDTYIKTLYSIHLMFLDGY
jgi:hypothetical protein